MRTVSVEPATASKLLVRFRPTSRLTKWQSLHCCTTRSKIRAVLSDCRTFAPVSGSVSPRSSLEVSLADNTHDAGASNTDLRAEGEVVWERFTGRKEGTLWYYRSLADTFARLVPGKASTRFALEVAKMQQSACSDNVAV